VTHDTHDVLRFAIPSKGRIAEPVQAFLASCGLAVSRPNPRQYAATIPTCPVVSVLFAHAEEIPGKVREGTVDVGMTGLDKLYESGEEDDERAQVIFSDLGIGRARIVLGVPEGWIDAWSVADLADLAVQYRDRGRDLRVSTDFPNITRSFLHRHGIHAFELLPTEGAVESAPSLGLADLVSTLLETGTSFRENRLKVLRGGTILATETCCIANCWNSSRLADVPRASTRSSRTYGGVLLTLWHATFGSVPRSRASRVPPSPACMAHPATLVTGMPQPWSYRPSG